MVPTKEMYDAKNSASPTKMQVTSYSCYPRAPSRSDDDGLGLPWIASTVFPGQASSNTHHTSLRTNRSLAERR